MSVAAAASSRKRSLSSASHGGTISPLPTYDNNPDNYRLGSILRVKMQNFMIYNEEEMRPGPGLNLLLGPNGSGKSTIVSAIGIALGGDTKSVGRFDKLSDYVKGGTNHSTVEVELFCGGRDGRHHLIVRRQFSKDGDKSTFYMGDSRGMREVNKKDVQAEMSRLNLQVNNLCVYLAQFRVGEFAELNPAGLLQETEKANDPKLHLQHLQLNEDHIALKKKAESEAGSRKMAESLAAEVASMEGEMKAQEERIETEKRIALLKKRLPWCKVDEALVEVERKKKLKEDRQKELDAEKAKHLPLQKALKQHEKAYHEAKLAEQKIRESVNEQKSKRARQWSQLEQHGQAIDGFETQLHDLDVEEGRAVASLEKETRNLVRAKAELAKCRPLGVIKSDMKHLEEEFAQHRQSDSNVTSKLNKVKTELLNATHEQKSTQTKLATIAAKPVNTPKRRLMHALGQGPQRTQAEREDLEVLNLQRDGKLHGKAHGPLLGVLKIVQDPHIDNSHCASFIETVITGKMRTAWIVENEHDWKLLLQSGIKTVIQAPKLGPTKRQINVDALRKHKIHYLEDAIECDDYVRSALHDTCRLSQLLYSELDLPADVLKNLMSSSKNDHKLQSLFMPHSQYSTAASPWTNDIAIRIDENIRAARVLGGDDTDNNAAERQSLEAKLAEIKEKLDELNQQYKELEKEQREEVAVRDARKNELNKRLSILGDEKRRTTSCEEIVRATQAAISRIENRPSTDQQKKKLQEQIHAHEDKRQVLIEDLLEMDTQLTAMNMTLVHASFEFAMKDREYTTLKAHVDSLASTDKRLRLALENAQQELAAAKRKAESLEQTARIGCDRAIFEEHRDWMAPDITIEAATALFDEFNLSLSRGIGDASIKERFDRTSRQLKEAEIRWALDKNEMGDLERRIQATKETWLKEVKEMVRIIDANFSMYFQRIGCQGHVVLAEENDAYGILIKVSFRQGVAVQTLSASAQSGGEKSVSTMLYLLCLQEVTNSPFRMVDEINQGMDANNERTVFNQIVKSCEPRRRQRNQMNDMEDGDDDVISESPQYFVVTPKLLPNLEYSDRVTIFNVYNGPSMLSQRDWDVDGFVKHAISGELDVAVARKKARLRKEQQASNAAAAEAEVVDEI